MNLCNIINEASQKYPHKTALIFKKNKLTYKILYKKIIQLSNGLIRLGLHKGDRVAILLDNSTEYIISYFAICHAGGIVVPINTFLKGDEIYFILKDAGIKILITINRFLKKLSLNNQFNENQLPSLVHIISCSEETEFITFNELLNSSPFDNKEAVSVYDNDVAAIIYTSGTTGHPKGAMLTHNNLISNVTSCLQVFTLKKKDKFLVFLPFFHSFTFTVCILLPCYVGCQIVILDEINRKQIKRCIVRYRITIFIAIPTVYYLLSKVKLSWLARIFNPIRIYISGAAPLPQETLKTFEENFKRPLLEGYGLSEASPVVSVNPLIGKRKPGSVGLPIPEVEVKIIDSEEKELPANTVGELIVKGPNVMKGYWKQPEITNQTIRNGWLLTGDMGKIDEEDYIYIVDRKKDMIISHGINIYPREIEEVLYKHPKIAEAAVIGIPDEHRGEIPKAYLALKQNVNMNEIEVKKFCQAHLANYKIPKKVEFREFLPKTPTGKILKRELRP